MDPSLPYFYRKEHVRFLERSLRFLSTGYECLDSSRPWMVYWILQSAHLLNFKFSSEVLADVVKFLSNCRSPLGGPFYYFEMKTIVHKIFFRFRRRTRSIATFGTNVCCSSEPLFDRNWWCIWSYWHVLQRKICSFRLKVYSIFFRDGIKSFLWSVRESNGAFRMHVDGELDVRGAYCAVTVARLSGISANNQLFEGTPQWIAECQTYEGSIQKIRP